MTCYKMDDGTIVKPENAVQSWKEKTRWDGRNHISIPTRSQWDHEDLHRSKRGRYWIESWSQYQGSVPVAQYVSAQDAARWLLLCEHELPADLVFIADELSE